MNACLRNGLFLAGLLAFAGCQKPGADQYHVITEESLDEPAKPAEAAAAPAVAREQVAESSTSDGGTSPLPPAVPDHDSSPEPVTASAAEPDQDSPPSAPLPRPLVAVVPPERTPRDEAARGTTDAEVARLRAELLGTAAGETRMNGQPRKIKLLVPEREFSREGAEKALRVTFDDIDLLKVLNMEPVPPDVMDHLPDWLAGLDGQRIVLRGWMYPPGRQEGISRFMFVRDNGICCFGRDPKVYDKLGVTLRPGQTTRYIEGRPFDVIGTLTIDAEIIVGDEGASWLYHIDDAIVVDR